MKHIALAATLGTVLLLGSNLILADFDQRDEDEAKAFEQQSQEAARKEALRKQKLEADNTKAKADMFRQALGAQANGKSDAEVITMMEGQEEALKKQYGPQLEQAEKNRGSPMSDEQADQALNDALRKASGDESISMEDLENMSDAELEALARKSQAQ
jgi:hypothetical protein